MDGFEHLFENTPDTNTPPQKSGNGFEHLFDDGKKTPQNTESQTHSPGTNTVSFDKVITSLKGKGDPKLNGYITILETVKKNLRYKNIPEVNDWLGKLQGKLQGKMSTEDYRDIYVYINNLETINSEYEEKREKITQKAKKDEEKESISMLNQLQEFVWSSESLKQIKAIEIGGSVSSEEEFLEKMQQVKQVVANTPEFKKLSPKNKEMVMVNIDTFTERIKGHKQKQLDFLDESYNRLASQIEHQEDDGNIIVKIGEDELTFSSKEEAFELIKALKQETHDELVSNGQYILNIMGSLFEEVLTSGFGIFTVHRITWNSAKWLNDTVFNTDEYPSGPAAFLLGTLGYLSYFFSISMTINYTETIYRRLVLDFLAKRGVSQIWTYKGKTILPFAGNKVKSGDTSGKTRILRIPDYSIQGTYFENYDANLQNEYRQRIQAIQKLEQAVNTKSGKERKKFEKELQKVKTYLNVNTDTFWLKAWSLGKNQGVFRKGWNAISGGPSIFGLHYRDAATRYFNIDKTTKEELERGLRYAFGDSVNLKITEKDGMNMIDEDSLKVIDVKNGKTNDIKYFENYVLSLSDITPEEQDRRIKNIQKYIESLKVVPASKKVIQSKLYSIAVKGYLSTEEVLSKINKLETDMYPYLKKEKSDLTWIDTGKNIWRKGQKLRAKKIPARFTTNMIMLYKFQDFVASGSWEGNQEDLNNIFTRVQTGEFGKSNELNKFAPKPTSREIEKVVKKGKSILADQKFIQKIQQEGIEVEEVKYKPIQALENYIQFKVPNQQETQMKKILSDFLEIVNEKQIMINDVRFFHELTRIKNGYIPSYNILKEFDRILADTDTSEGIRKNIQNFSESAKKGQLNITQKQLDGIKKGILTFDSTGSYIDTSDYTKAQRNEFLQEMKYENLEGLEQYDYKIRNFGDINESGELSEKIKKKYDDEIQYKKLLGKMGGYSFDIEGNIDKFSDNLLQNNYTTGQAKNILEQIFDGHDFASIDIDTIVKDTVNGELRKTFDITQKTKDEVLTQYRALDNSGKQDILKYIQDYSIQTSILPTEIQDDYEKRKHMPEIQRRQGALTSMTEEIQDANSRKKLNTLKEEFNTYVNNEAHQIDRKDPDFKSIIEEFNDSWNTKMEEVSAAEKAAAKKKAAKKATKEKAAARKAPTESKELMPADITKYLDDIYPSILLSGKDEALKELEKLYTQAYTEKLRTDIGDIKNLEGFINNKFITSGIIPKKITNFNSGNYKKVQEVLPKKYQSMRYSDIIQEFRGDIAEGKSAKKAILDAIKNIGK